jgi:hypothetical protein
LNKADPHDQKAVPSSAAQAKLGPKVEYIEDVLLQQERSKGFDPLGLTKDPDQYFSLREAEIKVIPYKPYTVDHHSS